MKRARRSAQAIVRGEEIVALITDLKIRRELIACAERGEPPVTIVGQRLIDELGIDFAKKLPVRQLAGNLIRGLLEEAGYEVAETGQRVKDPLFATGAVYRKILTREPAFEDWVSRLTAYKLLLKRLGLRS